MRAAHGLGTARRWVLALVFAVVLSPNAAASGGWSTSPVVTVERTRYPVTTVRPACEEELVIEAPAAAVATAVAALLALQPGGEAPAAVARRVAERVGDVSARVGSPLVLQRHASCTTVCAPLPLDARSVSAVRGFLANRPGEPFREQVVGSWAGNYLRFDPELDTTRVTDDARWACLRVRNWVAEFEREVFIVVRYER